MSEKRRDEEDDDDDDMPSAPAWMATFSDMMTLLMCFFILIMSFSTMELDKFKMAMGSLKGAFGIVGVQKKLQFDQNWFSPSTFSAYSIQQRSIMDHLEKMRSILENNELQDRVDVQWQENGEIYVQINDDMLFDGGSARLKPNYLKLLSIITKLFLREAENIVVEGHTDDRPIHTAQYPSNWELSLDRALTVLRHFVKAENIDPRKISAAGFGEYKPLVPNTTPANRAKNRRVTIRIQL